MQYLSWLPGSWRAGTWTKGAWRQAGADYGGGGGSAGQEYWRSPPRLRRPKKSKTKITSAQADFVLSETPQVELAEGAADELIRSLLGAMPGAKPPARSLHSARKPAAQAAAPLASPIALKSEIERQHDRLRKIALADDELLMLA